MSDQICFVIAPIGEADSEVRKRSDQVLKHIIRPAAEECGYMVLRADQISEPGIITSQIIQHIVDDPLVVADLTERNPNVFYELAIRHVIHKPLVQLIRKGDPIPFDVATMRTIPIDHRDLDLVEEAKAELVRQIRYVERPDARIETPITLAIQLQAFSQSDNPEQHTLSDLVRAVTDLRTSITQMQSSSSEVNLLIEIIKADDMDPTWRHELYQELVMKYLNTGRFSLSGLPESASEVRAENLSKPKKAGSGR